MGLDLPQGGIYHISVLRRVFAFAFVLTLLFPATLRKVYLEAGPSYTRVIFTLSSRAKVRTGKIRYRDKVLLYIDFYGTFPGRIRSRYYYSFSPVKMIRISRKDRRRLRAVIYLSRLGKYRVFFLPSPPRWVVDIFPGQGELTLSRQLGLKIKKIAIDPGHGGKDSGCVNRKLSLEEKHIVLDISLTLKALLEADGYEVILTREEDRFIPLARRTAMANNSEADLFISLHINWAENPSARGIETFYLNLAADPEAERVAAKENEYSGKSLSQMKELLKKIIMNEKIRESKLMARRIQKALVGNLRNYYPDVKDLGVRGAPFFVLMGAEMPSVLVEVSFLSNPQEAKRLKDPLYRARVAYGIYRGIEEFIKEVEGK